MGGLWDGVGGGSGECEQRIEVFVKCKKNRGWGSGGSGRVGVRVDVNEEVKVL